MKYVTIEIISEGTSENIKIEESHFAAAKKVFENQGYTMEQAINLFFKYVVEHGVPLTAEEIQTFKDDQQMVAGQKLPTIAQMRHISADYLANHLEETLELCHEQSAICIDINDKPDLVMMTMQAYEDFIGEKVELPNCDNHEWQEK